MPLSRAHISIHGGLEALMQHATGIVREAALRAVAARGRFAVATALAGLPRQSLERLTPADLAWSETHVFASDHSWSAPRHRPEGTKDGVPEAHEWLARLPAPRRNIHAVPAGSSDPHAAASAYEQQMRAFFGVAADDLPRFDLVLLEVGPDAHAASLFPFSESLDETGRLAVASYVPTLGRHCVTFTAPLINHAQEIVLFAAGAAVAPALAEMLGGTYQPRRLPAQLINPIDGRLHLLADHAAAASLPPARRAARAELNTDLTS